MVISDLKKYINQYPDDMKVNAEFVHDILHAVKRQHYICDICGKPVLKESGLANHKRFKHSSEVKP